MKINISFFIILMFFISSSFINQNSTQVALLKYNGGGDWYANPTSVPNLIKFCNKNINTKISEKIETVSISSSDIYDYPFIHMTGHGNVVFSNSDIENLRKYLLAGGFIHIDDNYGMDKFIRKEIKKLFPNKELKEIPHSHSIYNIHYKFPNGLPKIHEHDGKSPQGFGIFNGERMILFYTFESDLGDGWEDAEVHNDPENIRLQALKMGANIVKYALTK